MGTLARYRPCSLSVGPFRSIIFLSREDLSQYLMPSFPYKYVHMRNFDENSLRLLFERIFNCEFICLSSGPYVPGHGRLKYSFPFPKFEGILNRLISSIKPVNEHIYEKIVQIFYHPIEINIVVKKC